MSFYPVLPDLQPPHPPPFLPVVHHQLLLHPGGPGGPPPHPGGPGGHPFRLLHHLTPLGQTYSLPVAVDIPIAFASNLAQSKVKLASDLIFCTIRL